MCLEAEARGSLETEVWGQFGQYSKTLSQKKQKKQTIIREQEVNPHIYGQIIFL
jgi:hypothetical protein